jgi:hypothetical protein
MRHIVTYPIWFVQCSACSLFTYVSFQKVARGGAVVEALRYSRKFAGSIPDGVIGLFHYHNPSGRTMALGSI